MTWTRGFRDKKVDDNPIQNSLVWDIVFFAGKPCPGIAKVDVRIPDGLDHKKSKGVKRSTFTDNGDPAIEFKIEVRLQPTELIPFANETLHLLRTKNAKGGRKPLSFNHPLAELTGVKNVIVGPIDIPTPKPGGVMVVSFTAYEWIKAPKTVVASTKVKTETRRVLINLIPSPFTDEEIGTFIDALSGLEVPNSSGQF